MKSTLFNMVMVLFVITLLASAGVGAVHMITEEPIAEARVKATREARSNRCCPSSTKRRIRH